jgi:hypothetical protein
MSFWQSRAVFVVGILLFQNGLCFVLPRPRHVSFHHESSSLQFKLREVLPQSVAAPEIPMQTLASSTTKEEEMLSSTSITMQNSSIAESDLDYKSYNFASIALLLTVTIGAMAVGLGPQSAMAAGRSELQFDMFDPSQFQPVCPGSDGIYQLLKFAANSLVGADNVVEYGPLIASVLLRVRLELCVLESFIYDAVIPIFSTKGLSWILPIHETVETVLAGTIFAVASNFILLGSTKILSVLFIYADALTGMPSRFLGGAAKKNLKGPGSALGAGFKAYGDALGAVRGFLEGADTFVGRYLVVATTVYIAFKVCHYKLFNDIF